MSVPESPNSIMPTLRQSPGQVPDKNADLSRTQIMKVRDTNRVADFHDLCPRQVRDFVVNLSRTLSQTLSPTVLVHCNRLNSIRTTQTTLSQTLSRTLSQTSRHVEMVCVRDFRDLCPRLSPRGSFGESQRNGIWAETNTRIWFLFNWLLLSLSVSRRHIHLYL